MHSKASLRNDRRTLENNCMRIAGVDAVIHAASPLPGADKPEDMIKVCTSVHGEQCLLTEFTAESMQ